MREGFRPRLWRTGLAAVVPLVFGGCGSVGCDDAVLQREPRPDARGAAVAFVRKCAMRGVSTQVALLRHVDAPPRAGEVLFVADADGGGAPAGPRGGPEVHIRWIDVNHLEIAHDRRVRPVRRSPVQRDLRVTYVHPR